MKKEALCTLILIIFLYSCSPLEVPIGLPSEPLPDVPVSENIAHESTAIETAKSDENQNKIVPPEEIPGQPEEELAFDLSVEQAQPMDFDSRGPYFHTVFKASSADGLSFSQEAEVVFEHTSVPDVLRLPDGRIALYAVDGAGRSKSGLLVAFSDDDGESWKTGSVQVESNVERFGLADPEVVLLPDGTVRMYYVIFPQPNVHTGNNQIWSAVSSDGLHFVEEEGIRFTYERLTDPDVVKIGSRWFIYFSQGPRLVAASSIDGNTFTLEKTIREQGSVSNTVPLGNTQWRQYYCKEGIKSAVSSDGLNWRDDSGTRITADAGSIVCDPAPLKTDDGWIVFYKVSPGES